MFRSIPNFYVYIWMTILTFQYDYTLGWKLNHRFNQIGSSIGTIILSTSTLLSQAPIPSFSETHAIETSALQSTIDKGRLQSSEQQIISLFQRITPSVVYITTFVERLDAFSLNVYEIPQGTGSGFVWDNQGHIVTNFHVIRNSGSAKVVLTGSNGKSQSFKADVTGVDPDKDIAVLKIDPTSIEDPNIVIKPIALGTSANLLVGQTTLAIGNPFGLDHSLSTGVVSGLGREVRSPSNRPISNVIQTDAAINPGNSGGPLLDSSGRLIGMNTAIYTTSGGSAGIGFAIPVDTLKYEVNALIKDGKITRPALGITYLDSSQARSLGIQKGILVLDVPAGSPAAAAGVKGTERSDSGSVILGDIITKIDGDEITSETDLFKAIEKHQVGDRISLVVLRRVEPITTTTDNNVAINKFEAVILSLVLSSKDSIQIN